MWRTFADSQTKRAFTNLIDVRRKFFTNHFEDGMNLEVWIDSLEKQRRTLANLGRVIGEDDYVEIIFDHVTEEFREFVRQHESRFEQRDAVRPPRFKCSTLYALRTRHACAFGTRRTRRPAQRS